ncbi:MAG: NADH-quinone oxidoreductase subunit N, partial [Bacteroidales bacterium]|nr:NADH-quinone oxidoreductase subunit N [Bacteroidales bacterium]
MEKTFIGCFFATSLLSLAGLPLTAGFISKFYVVLAGISAGKMLLIVVLIVGSAIGIFY